MSRVKQCLIMKYFKNQRGFTSEFKKGKKKNLCDKTKHDDFLEGRNLPCNLENVKVMALGAV